MSIRNNDKMMALRTGDRRVLVGRVAAVALTFASGACGSSTPTGPTPPPLPVVTNAPPTITAVKVASDRVEADQGIEVTAVVTDIDTPLDRLTYTWSASPASGTFIGSGPQVTWRAPRGQKTPDLYTLTITVTEDDTSESYRSAGGARRNKVSATVQVHYNDSVSEVNGIASQFIADFGTFSVSPEQCVRNFSDSCPGKQDELSDIRNNRANFHILSSTFTAAQITFNSSRTSGTVLGPCVFEDIPNATGKRERVSGDCFLTTVYENWRWWLCDSFFLNGTVTPESLRYRVSGRVVGLK